MVADDAISSEPDLNVSMSLSSDADLPHTITCFFFKGAVSLWRVSSKNFFFHLSKYSLHS